MTKELGVGLVGLAGIARTHIPGWEASPHAEIRGACDINQNVLESWGNTHRVSQLTTETNELLSNPDIDIVDLCVPNHQHAPLAIAALEAGKHVLCEKPLSPTTEDIKRMIEARDKSGKLLMTAQHFRFHGAAQAIKKKTSSGSLGDIYHARVWQLRRTGIPSKSSFVNKESSGGGALIDIGVHALDLALWLMGNPQPLSVSGVAKTKLANHQGAFTTLGSQQAIPSRISVEDFGAAFVRLEGGATIVLEVSWLLHHSHEGLEDMQIWLYGSDGGCHWPSAEFYGTNYSTRQTYDQKLFVNQDPLTPHARECIEFARAISEGLPSPVPAEQSLQVMEILNGAYKSEEIGKEVWLV